MKSLLEWQGQNKNPAAAGFGDDRSDVSGGIVRFAAARHKSQQSQSRDKHGVGLGFGYGRYGAGTGGRIDVENIECPLIVALVKRRNP